MKRIDVASSQGTYEVRVGSDLLAGLGSWTAELIQGQSCLVVSDSQVGAIYLKEVISSLKQAGLTPFSYMFPPGESQKNSHTLNLIYKVLNDVGITRADGLIALGGGVVGDVAGYAAATYRRGIPYIQVPTSLLAQVDSSVGGKTAIDMPFGKNMVGAFYQPEGVLADTNVLQTLAPAHLSEGMGEVIKYGCIADETLFEFCRSGRPPEEQQIARCVEIKAAIVRNDEFDTGERMLLNFGHTLGHAVERATGYAMYTHGAAVAIGMRAAVRIGERLGVTPEGTEQRLLAAIETWNLPTAAAIDAEEVLAAARTDKKWLSGTLNFILLESIGKAVIYPMSGEELTALVKETWVEDGVDE